MPTIHLTEPQARALHDHGRFGQRPTMMSGRTARALTRAVEKLREALEGKQPDAFADDLQQLMEVLLDVRRRPFVDFIHGRLRDLLTVAIVWSAAEELPQAIRDAVLDLDKLTDGGRMAEVLDRLEAHQIEVKLPGETREGAR